MTVLCSNVNDGDDIILVVNILIRNFYHFRGIVLLSGLQRLLDDWMTVMELVNGAAILPFLLYPIILLEEEKLRHDAVENSDPEYGVSNWNN